MLFSTAAYFLFFFITAAALYCLPARWRSAILLLASYFFYAWWNWRFVPLLAGLTIVDYFAARWVELSHGHYRRAALALSIIANLGMLAFFKYYNFVAGNLAHILGYPSQSFHLNILLPLGISFHTFQSISYVVDVYRREQAAIRKFPEYALYISFFPQLVAGPIVRAHHFFADLNAWRPAVSQEIKRGAFSIVMGLTKKIVLADNLAVVADQYFAQPQLQAGWLSAVGGVLSFALQIFFDFSGYTDIAIGSALLLGFHFPINFKRPYLAISMTDFWRRWHISLSEWLRDYLYIPLGGSRYGRVKTYRNLLLTMLLGGLWHGANWTFVAWGAYHGILLALERMFDWAHIRKWPWRWSDTPRTLATFLLVSLGWVFFRAESFEKASLVLRALFRPPVGVWPVEPLLVLLISFASIIAVVEERGWISRRVENAPLLEAGVYLGAMLFLVEVFAPEQSRPFVYFQF